MDISDLIQQFHEATRANDTHMYVIAGATLLITVAAGAWLGSGGKADNEEGAFVGSSIGILASVITIPMMVLMLLPVVGPDVDTMRTEVMTEITDTTNEHYGTNLSEPVVNEAFWASAPGEPVKPVLAEVEHDGERQIVEVAVDRDQGTITVYENDTELTPAK